MHQAATSIWNDIAASQTFRSEGWKRLFSLDQSALGAALEDIESELEAQGYDATTIRAYILTAPLLCENEAISNFVVETDQAWLRGALPELVSIDEAIQLASLEFRLLPAQAVALRHLLSEAMDALDE